MFTFNQDINFEIVEHTVYGENAVGCGRTHANQHENDN